MRELAQLTCALALLSACTGAESATNGHLVFEFRVGRELVREIPDGEHRSQSPRDCVANPLERTIVYTSPAGATQPFQIDRDAHLRLRLAPVKIMLTEYHDELSPGVVVARAALSGDELEAASKFRELHGHCTILVAVNGETVWVDENGARWTDAVPAGAYKTEERARSRLAEGPWPVVWKEWPALQRSMRFWRWRQAMDVWEYACNEEIRQAVDAANPEAAELLRKELDEIDCSVPPAMEE